MHVEPKFLFQACRRSAAEVGCVAGDFVAERFTGDRVNRQRHGDVGEFRGQYAVVFRGMKAQGLDVSKKRNPLVQATLREADVTQGGH